jgi:polysaccharide biosynthesis protein PelD
VKWQRLSRYFLGALDHPWLGWMAWLETALVSLLALAIGYWVRPQDPFFIQSEFPWPLLAPILVSLRYGAGPGTFSILLFIACFILGNGTLFQIPFTPKSYFLGGILVTLLCGEFSSSWQNQVRRRDKFAYYIDERLERLTQRHYLLSLSHDRLEQAQISRPATLRDGMLQLQGLALAEERAVLPAAQQFLAIIAQYCQVECASLHAIESGGRIVRDPAASVGEAPVLAEDDPMLLQALRSEKLAHLQAEQLLGDPVSRYLIVVPIKPSGRPLIGVILVTKLPFFALHEDTTKTLATLSIYYADLLAVQREGADLRRDLPDCPPAFSAELKHLDRIARETSLPSAVVAVVFGPDPHREEMLFQIRRQRRALDVQWTLERGQTSILLTLMPLAGLGPVEGYLVRIQLWLEEQYGVQGIAQLHISTHIMQVGKSEPLSGLRQLLADCGHHA